MRGKLVIMLLIVLAVSSAPIYAQESQSITINIDGENVIFDKQFGEPFADENSRTQVPFRIVLESFGAEVSWDNTEKIAIASKDEITVYVPMGEDYIFKNEEKILNDTKSQAKDGRIYLPIRIVMEAFGCQVGWDQTSHTVIITSAIDSEENTETEEVSELKVIPVKYDLREFDKVTSIKNQGIIGACWAFGSLAAIESFLMPEENYDFSEDNLSIRHGFDLNQNQGGHYRMSLAYFTRWDGPVLEKDDVYADGVANSDAKVVKHVQEAVMIQSKDINKIKEMLMEYGAVQTSIYSPILVNEDIKDLYYNEKTFALYNYGKNESNHDITIVGWDDEYNKKNFLVQPEDNGAFICKNSWGEEFGEKGYYYISYYDNNIAKDNIVYTKVEDISNYDNIYQYDELGWVRSVGYNEEPVYFSNVYTAKEDEIIKAASFYTTGINTSYQVYVVNDFEGDFDNRKLVASGNKEMIGYYTVDLEETKVAKDEKFAVVVKIQTPNSETPVAIETLKRDLHVSEVVVNSGESYISPDGEKWEDLSASKDIKSNVCLKVFTNKKLIKEENSIEEEVEPTKEDAIEEVVAPTKEDAIEEETVATEAISTEEDSTGGEATAKEENLIQGEATIKEDLIEDVITEKEEDIIEQEID